MVEIRKKNIVDRNSSAVEPIDRNCSVSVIYFPYKQVTDDIIQR